MALTNDQITAQNFKDFYEQIRPYLNGQVPTFANQFSRSDLYSTDEKIIGQWIDGKPLYQKTISFGNITLAANAETTSYVTDPVCAFIERLIGWEGTSSNNGIISTYINPTAATQSWQLTYAEVDGAWKFRLRGTRKLTSSIDFYNVYTTIRYTKTTDSAIKVGTGTDYSTDEQIIGSWIDGKPLYQKTYVMTDFSNKTVGTNSSRISIAHGISSLGDVVSMYGVVKFSYDNGATWSQRPMNGYIVSSYGDLDTTAAKDKMSAYVNISSTDYNLAIGNDILSKYGVKTTFTIRYTKTTD